MSNHNLSKSFYFGVTRSSQDVVSLYKCFMNSALGKKDEGIYRKWMQLPQQDFAYVLDISKPGTKKRVDELRKNSTQNNRIIDGVRINEIIEENEQREQITIRLVQIINKNKGNQCFNEVQTDFSDLIMVHCISQHQKQLQDENLDYQEESQMSIFQVKREEVDEEYQMNSLTFEDQHISKDQKHNNDYQNRNESEDNVEELLQLQSEKLKKKKQKIKTMKSTIEEQNGKLEDFLNKLQQMQERLDESELLRRGSLQKIFERDLKQEQMRLSIKILKEENEQQKEQKKELDKCIQREKELIKENEQIRIQILSQEDKVLKLIQENQAINKELDTERFQNQKLLLKISKRKIKFKTIKKQLSLHQQKQEQQQNQNEKEEKAIQELVNYFASEMMQLKNRRDDEIQQNAQCRSEIQRLRLKLKDSHNHYHHSSVNNNQYSDRKLPIKDHKIKKNYQSILHSIRTPSVSQSPPLHQMYEENHRKELSDLKLETDFQNLYGEHDSNTEIVHQNVQNHILVNDLKQEDNQVPSHEYAPYSPTSNTSITFHNNYNQISYPPKQEYYVPQTPLKDAYKKSFSTSLNANKQEFDQMTPPRRKKTDEEMLEGEPLTLSAKELATIQEQKEFNKRLTQREEMSSMTTFAKCCDQIQQFVTLTAKSTDETASSLKSSVPFKRSKKSTPQQTTSCKKTQNSSIFNKENSSDLSRQTTQSKQLFNSSHQKKPETPKFLPFAECRVPNSSIKQGLQKGNQSSQASMK